MNKRISHFMSLLVSFVLALTNGNPTPGVEQEEVNHGERQIEWLRSKGGYVNAKLEIRREDPNDPNSRFGMFAKEAVKKKEILLIIPRECLITEEGNDNWQEGINCGTVNNLVREMRLGGESFYSAYVNYLLDEPWGNLPSSWSHAGKKMFLDMQFKHTRFPIPPAGATEWINYEWRELCEGSTDPFEENAMLIVVQRSWDNLLIPVYDMMSHRNGHWLNTESNSVHGKDSIVVKAKRDVESGEELYVSYNMCEDCGGRARTYGTFEILRDYGFVEQYPQRWIFPDTVGFEVDEKLVGSGEFTLSWIGEEPGEDDIDCLEEVRFAMEQTSLVLPDDNIKPNELATIRHFQQSLLQAVELAIDYAIGEEEKCSNEDETCEIIADRYENFDVDTEEDDFVTRTCDNEDIMLFDDYDIIDEIQTPYQYISVMHNPTNNDMCFDLDNIVQIATSYRPHYHEMVVHYAARFLKDIKRVLFVGGGDSMLLHEVIKYPNLELVIGLELDQQVTRMSFKHFGVQPLWFNEKVQWWYGDATKSLLMLPKELFGTFDMVLVDLSETVMSFKVTDELDVVEALSLLLKPDGIMVKNELYFEDLSDIFEHTLQIHFTDVPVICSQALILGSNNINFLKENITNHGIDNQNLYIMPDKDHFSIVHDYVYTPTNRQKHCKQKDDEPEKLSSEQTKSPGIIMCIEAEKASLLVSGSLENVAELVGKTLENKGLTLTYTFLPKITDNTLVIIMKEGYLTARLWFKEKYCAFDLHLWSSFEKQESVKRALISSIGSSPQTSSSFRVVAGGMFGVESWENDENNRGPIHTDTCERPNEAPGSVMNQEAMNIILKETLNLAGTQGGSAVLVCGKDNSLSCLSAQELQRVESVRNIHILWSCIDDDKETERYPWLMYTCEQEIMNLLKLKSKETKFSIIIFDETMGYRMGQVMFNILKSLRIRRESFTPNLAAVELSLNGSDPWRRIAMNQIRKNIIYYDPVFLAQIFYNSSDSNVEVNVVAKDKLFIQRLKEVMSSIEKQTDLISVVQSIKGGIAHFDHNFTPNPFYKPSDYDQSLPTEQWSSQQPLEDQTIFQLEGGDVPISNIHIKEGLEETLRLLNSNDFTSGRAEIKEFSNVGDGCVFVALWSRGRAIVVWDGRNHIDINLSILAKTDIATATFDEHFIKYLPFHMKTILRDVQSRGYGRVVNFLKDTSSEFRPLWI